MRIKSLFVTTGLLVLACSGTDRSGASRTIAALENVDDEHVAVILLAGFSESGVGGSACSQGLGAVANADPAQRATIFAAMIPDCPDTCVPKARFGELAVDSPSTRITHALQICDAAGPDPVFGSALAASRANMDAMDYLIVRMVIEQVWNDLGKNSDEGRRLDALRPRIARSLVAQNQPQPSPF